MKTPLTETELLKIAHSLEDYHACFFKFWEMSAVYKVDDATCPTAAVYFGPHDSNAKPELWINDNFWNWMTHRERVFVICHECLHVLLDHGVRDGLLVAGSTPMLVNKAQDITINEMIVDMFGFDRDELRDWRKYCWIDTCFPDSWHAVARHETFIYYLELMIKKPPPKEEDGGPKPLDEHGTPQQSQGGAGDPSPAGQGQQADAEPKTPGEGETQEQKDAKAAAAQAIAEELSPAELEELIKAMGEGGDEAGYGQGMYQMILERKTVKVKFKFKNILKKLKRSSIKEEEFDEETFVKDDRRFDDLIHNAKIALPGKHDGIRLRKDRLLTAIFMDVSGSCMDYISTFGRVAQCFEDEKKYFETRLFTFDTFVTDLNNKNRNFKAGGGTSFSIIEEQCIMMEAETGKYPDCVIVITDGYGSIVTPKAPTHWVWLLTPMNSKTYIHPKSRSWLVKDIVL